MASSALLEVTPREARVATGRLDPPLPADLAAVLEREGVSLSHGWTRHGNRPWRMSWQLSGPDRVAVARRLEAELRLLGYEADAIFSP
jgi:hypothetical protein